MNSKIYKDKNIRTKNKIRKVTKYLKKKPNDLQAKAYLEGLTKR